MADEYLTALDHKASIVIEGLDFTVNDLIKLFTRIDSNSLLESSDRVVTPVDRFDDVVDGDCDIWPRLGMIRGLFFWFDLFHK